jgi:hypothetical protein
MSATMKASMQSTKGELSKLLEQHELTAGMYLRVHGDNLIMGRTDDSGSDPINEDHVRLTRLSSKQYGLSVKRHTGRWERTPFSGSMKEMVDIMLAFMQHLVAPY